MASQGKSSKQGRNKVKCTSYKNRGTHDRNKAKRIVAYTLARPGHKGKEVEVAKASVGKNDSGTLSCVLKLLKAKGFKTD